MLIGCSGKIAEPSGCPDNVAALASFTTPDGQNVMVYEDGKAYVIEDGTCTFAVQYFDPDFMAEHYVTTAAGTFLIADGGELFPTKSDFVEDFEGHAKFTELFVTSLADTQLYWTSFTLQSPAAPTVPDYVALRKCILDGTCTFIDNRIDLVPDPEDGGNTVLKFTSVAPNADMITAKSSIASSLNYYLKDSEVWFQADYFIESGMPFSLVDFENSYFDEAPGPRVVIRGRKLAIENKFGAKQNFTHESDASIPMNRWFTVKVHLKYSDENDGVVELWQDGAQLISTTGVTLPTLNSIQNVLEVGVSATPVGCTLLVDDVRISATAF